MIEALLINAALLLAAVSLLWLLSIAIGKVGFVDAVWGGAMAALAVASVVQLERPGDLALLILGMTTAWGVRLFLHLLTRFLRHGEDERYEKLLADARENGRWWLAAGIRVWLLQSVLLFAVSSPAQVGILASEEPAPIAPLAWLGLALWLVGVFFEWVGDWQLARFKAHRDTKGVGKGEILDTGLWRYTRHPNYFGDACAWWGIWLACASAGWEFAAWTAIGPIFLTFTLVKWSGAAMTEKGMRKKHGQAFADYVERTSAFIPWPPKA